MGHAHASHMAQDVFVSQSNGRNRYRDMRNKNQHNKSCWFVDAQSMQLIILHETAQLTFPSHHNISNGQKVDAKRLPHKTRMALALQGPTLIFDGICNLCNGSMGWFQERVRKEDSPVWYSK